MSDQYTALHTRIRDLIMKAESDPALREQLKHDPESVLGEHSLSVDDVREASKAFADLRVSTELICNDLTCWSSECPGSCFVSYCMHTHW